jgi:glutamate--cysteine ligase
MREYLPTRGSGALDMMQRTATVQGNFDYSDQKDALKKLLVGLRMAPLVNAWVANSPYVEGVFSGKLSARGDVWLRMEPERSGLIDRLWGLTEPGYDDYVEWALEAPMFLVKRAGRIIDNSGQPFQDFLEHGFHGERATQHDWVLHVNSLFPEARLKNTLELRSVDSLPPRLASAVMTLFTGLLYDATSLSDASELLQQVSLAEVQACRPELLTRGLATSYGSWEGFSIARQLLELARAGLRRRGRRWQGHDESGLLDPLAELLEARTTPAQRLLDRLGSQPEPARLAALCCDSRPA